MKLKIVVPEYEKSVIFVYGNITQSLSRFLKSNYHPMTNHKSNIQDKYDWFDLVFNLRVVMTAGFFLKRCAYLTSIN